MLTPMNWNQYQALKNVWARSPEWNQEHHNGDFQSFLNSVSRGYDCLMVQWCGMWLGIESDGYTHS